MIVGTIREEIILWKTINEDWFLIGTLLIVRVPTYGIK